MTKITVSIFREYLDKVVCFGYDLRKRKNYMTDRSRIDVQFWSL